MREGLEENSRPRLGKRKQEKLPPAQKIPELNQGEIIIVTDSGFAEGIPPAEKTDHAKEDGKEQFIEAKNAGLIQRIEAHKRLQEKRQQLKKNKSSKSSESKNNRTCIKCGKTSSEDARFCQYCGNPLDS